MNNELILALVLLSVLATDVAVVALFLTIRPHLRAASAGAADITTVIAELAALVAQINGRAEQAASELERQRAQLQQLVAAPAPVRRKPSPPPGARAAAAAEHTFSGGSYATARRMGVSAEEVRLRQALQRRASA